MLTNPRVRDSRLECPEGYTDMSMYGKNLLGRCKSHLLLL